MKKIGFVGVADATTWIGDVIVVPLVGLDTVSEKSVAPLAQSVPCGGTAVGAGNGLDDGLQVIATGGTEG
jgi:hypothetical protein